MNYLKQFLIIMGISTLGELLHELIPLTVPASIYGMLLMFAGLYTGLIPLSSVKDTGKWLVAVMPVMFIPAAAGLIDAAPLLKANGVAYALITVITTVLVMVIVGTVTQAVMRGGKKHD
ncbi:MAG: CidA/LrgA family protein [Firmicutes bacterium]|nr:CidA/LrgA family protein [Bacillota bacterium]